MVSKTEIGENDKKLAEILNEVDDMEVDKSPSEEEFRLIRDKIGVLLRRGKFSGAATYELVTEYAEYVPSYELECYRKVHNLN